MTTEKVPSKRRRRRRRRRSGDDLAQVHFKASLNVDQETAALDSEAKNAPIYHRATEKPGVLAAREGRENKEGDEEGEAARARWPARPTPSATATAGAGGRGRASVGRPLFGCLCRSVGVVGFDVELKLLLRPKSEKSAVARPAAVRPLPPPIRRRRRRRRGRHQKVGTSARSIFGHEDIGSKKQRGKKWKFTILRPPSASRPLSPSCYAEQTEHRGSSREQCTKRPTIHSQSEERSQRRGGRLPIAIVSYRSGIENSDRTD